MTRTRNDVNSNVVRLISSLNDDTAIAQKVAILRSLREQFPDQAAEIDTLILTHLVKARMGVRASQDSHKELANLLASLTEPPLISAIFAGELLVWDTPRARVLIGESQRIVNFGPEIDRAKIDKGDEVFLNKELNVIVDFSRDGVPPFGETASFVRMAPEGRRMILNYHEQEIVVDVAKPLQRRDDLERGDMIRFARNTWMAYEKIEQDHDRQDFREKELPKDITPESVGGQEENLQTLLDALSCTLLAPERAEAYGLSGRRSIMLVGPPGTGKTLLAKVAATELEKLSQQKCRFFSVKPGEFQDSYVGSTERRIRECFQDLADAAESGLAILFLDEVESSVGRIRGGIGGHHSDRFLAALLAELDGFRDRKNVAIISASNRKDMIDPALLERLSEIEINVGRPNTDGARAIFDIHLGPEIPYCPNGASASATRESIIEAAVSRLYAPNANNEICTIKFRDGVTRVVNARELMSGRLISQICLAARQAAFSREVRTGHDNDSKPGLTMADMHDSVSDALTKARTMLTRHNAHAYLSDLPQDVDVVSVEPIQRKVTHPHEYIIHR